VPLLAACGALKGSVVDQSIAEVLSLKGAGSEQMASWPCWNAASRLAAEGNGPCRAHCPVKPLNTIRVITVGMARLRCLSSRLCLSGGCGSVGAAPVGSTRS
jgi:hypothetical protein